MTRTKVIMRVASALVAGAALSTIAVGTASADYAKCAHTKAVSMVCPNGGTGTPEGGDTRPSADVPGSNGWGYTHEIVDGRSTQKWGKKDG